MRLPRTGRLVWGPHGRGRRKGRTLWIRSLLTQSPSPLRPSAVPCGRNWCGRNEPRSLPGPRTDAARGSPGVAGTVWFTRVVCSVRARAGKRLPMCSTPRSWSSCRAAPVGRSSASTASEARPFGRVSRTPGRTGTQHKCAIDAASGRPRISRCKRCSRATRSSAGRVGINCVATGAAIEYRQADRDPELGGGLRRRRVS